MLPIDRLIAVIRTRHQTYHVPYVPPVEGANVEITASGDMLIHESSECALDGAHAREQTDPVPNLF